MGTSPDRIFIVAHDPEIIDLIGRQTLQPLGYQVQTAGDAAIAIPRVQEFHPDAIIIDLDLPGLSGKDLLLGLASQGIQIPAIVVARRGKEADAIQAFRLGASDYLIWPARDTEVASAVERVYKLVRERRERASLSLQLQQINQELQARVRELTAVSSVGKSITTLARPRDLHERIMEGGLRVSSADLGWLILRTGDEKTFILAAQRGLPAHLAKQVNCAWDDGLSKLVAASGESLSIYGEPLKRFSSFADLGQSALIVPIQIDKQVSGLLVMLRKALRPFTPTEQSLLEATAEYAAIAMSNLRTFQALEARQATRQEASASAQDPDKARVERLQKLGAELRNPLESALDYTGQLLRGRKGRLPTELQPTVFSIQEKLTQMSRLVVQMSSSSAASMPKLGVVNLNDLSRQALARFHRLAQQNGLSLASELASPPVIAWGDAVVLAQVLDGLLSNALKFSPPGRQVTVSTGRTAENLPLLSVRDTGKGIDPQRLAHLFDARVQKDEPFAILPANDAPGLRAIQDLITACGGKIWADSRLDEGSTFYLVLPLPKQKQNP